MASDSLNITEDAEMAECDGDKVVTMMDVLQEQQDFEEDANAVLGASDDKNCTYVKGYIKRQALYACLTCCSDAKTDPTKRAGVCLACSLNCHENHELVELYTKRNFRCDCGNPKFNSHPCQFTANKPDENEDNIYNQNFSGLYCICQRPYPDPEATVDEDMIQCIICEDWLHASHLDTVVPANNQYSEMICKGCMEKNEFLHDYSKFAVNVESGDVDVLTINSNDSTSNICNGDMSKDALTNGDVELKGVTQNRESEMAECKEKDANESVSDEYEKNKEISEKGTNMNLDTESQKQEPQSKDNKEENENPKTGEESITTTVAGDSIEDKNDLTATSEQTPKSDNKVDNKTDHTGDVKADGDNADSNKTEDQLLDDIRALTSNEETTVTSNYEENSAESSKVEDKTNNDDHVKKPTTDQTKDENSATTLEKEKNEENTDDKTDAVMDAIDALLKDPTEQNSDEVLAMKDKTENMEKLDDKQVTIEPNKTNSTDIEMTENKSQDETGTPVDTKPENIELPHTENTDDKTITENKDDSDINIETKTLHESEATNKPEDESTSKNETSLEEDKESVSDNKRKLSVEAEEMSPKKAKLDIDKCVRPKGVRKIYRGATFWPSNFRQKLCTCGGCITMYKDLHVLFLTDPEDTVSAYESLGKENIDGGASQYEKGLQALSSLDRIQQINALTEYNKMRDKLLDFLKSFKDKKEVVREEDIRSFFAGMKPRREPDGVYFCR